MHAVPFAGPAHASSKLLSALAPASSWMSIQRTFCSAAHSSASSSLSRRPTSIPIRSRKLIRLLRSLLPGGTLTFQILHVPEEISSPLHDRDPCITAYTIGAAAADM